jgi:hypothetical protein
MSNYKQVTYRLNIRIVNYYKNKKQILSRLAFQECYSGVFQLFVIICSIKIQSSLIYNQVYNQFFIDCTKNYNLFQQIILTAVLHCLNKFFEYRIVVDLASE